MSRSDALVPDDSLYDLAFDQFSRQYHMKQLIESVRPKRRLKILDVGGNNGKTREFFPRDEVMIADLYDIEEPGYTKASALDLPFADNSYDVVTCFDVFEHIEQKDRQQFLSEISRVAKHFIVVAAPFNTQYVANAEQELNNYYKTITGNDHRWLKEHIDNGLPEQNEIEAYYTKSGLALKTYSSNNILLWTGMQNLIFLADSVKAPERLSNLNRFYNEHLTSLGDGVEPSYRRIYFVVKDGKMPDDVEITQPIDPDAVRHLINSAALATNEIIYGSAPVREKTEIIREKNEAIHTQAGQLAEKDREIARLHNNLNDILGSRSYRIAQALKATKNALSPKRRK